MRTLKNIFQTTFIIVLFVVTSLSTNAQDIALNQNDWISETAPSILGINYEDISYNVEVYQKNKTYYLELKGNLEGVFETTIFNVEGQTLQTFEVHKTAKKQKFEILTENLEKGIYIVEIKQGQKKAYKRLYKDNSETAF